MWDPESGAVRAEPGQRVTTVAFNGIDRFVTGSSALDTVQDNGDALEANALRVWDPAGGSRFGV